MPSRFTVLHRRRGDVEVKSANHRPGERCIVASAAIPEVIHPDVLTPTVPGAGQQHPCRPLGGTRVLQPSDGTASNLLDKLAGRRPHPCRANARVSVRASPDVWPAEIALRYNPERVGTSASC